MSLGKYKIIIIAGLAFFAGILTFSWIKEQNNKIASIAQPDIKNTQVNLPQKPPEENPNLAKFYAPILLYHHIAYTKTENSYYVSPKIFSQQMQWLKDNGYNVISFDKFYLASTGKSGLPEKPVVITFDDSLLDQYTNAYPILKKFQYPATFFVKLNDVSSRGTTALTFSEIKEMAQNGMTIGSHSMNHDDMANMDPDTMYYELNQSKKILEQNCGIKIKYFSYPGGAYSKATIIATEDAGYLAAVTTQHKVYQQITSRSSLYTLPRIHIDNEMPSFIDWVQGKNLH